MTLNCISLDKWYSAVSLSVPQFAFPFAASLYTNPLNKYPCNSASALTTAICPVTGTDCDTGDVGLSSNQQRGKEIERKRGRERERLMTLQIRCTLAFSLLFFSPFFPPPPLETCSSHRWSNCLSFLLSLPLPLSLLLSVSLQPSRLQQSVHSDLKFISLPVQLHWPWPENHSEWVDIHSRSYFLFFFLSFSLPPPHFCFPLTRLWVNNSQMQ